MYVIPIYLSFIYFSIKSIVYFGIFLVISVNLRLFWYCIISTVSPHFGSADFFCVNIIMSKNADISTTFVDIKLHTLLQYSLGFFFL